VTYCQHCLWRKYVFKISMLHMWLFVGSQMSFIFTSMKIMIRKKKTKQNAGMEDRVILFLVFFEKICYALPRSNNPHDC